MSWFPRVLKRDTMPKGTIAPLGPVTFAPLPLEAGANDIFAEGYQYPKGNSDRYKWYNNTFWGNRLPDSGVGIGIPGYNAVTQKMFWTQYSPEQTAIDNWQLRGGPYQYKMSVGQSANILDRMTAAWRAGTAQNTGVY